MKRTAKQKQAAPKRSARPAKRKPAVKAKAKAKAKPKPKRKPARKPPRDRWTRFVEQHGVVLASAKGPVPSVAEAIAGEPIVGSWWSHEKAQAIFDALSAIDVPGAVRCFKLVDDKITFVHRRVWPALVKLVTAGAIARDRAASIQQEHTPTGAHRNVTTPFPDWVPADVAAAAEALSVADAKHQLGTWV